MATIGNSLNINTSGYQKFNANTGSFTAASVIPPQDGGTGISNNASSTITISGSFPLTATLTGSTSVTFPTSGTLATTASLSGASGTVLGGTGSGSAFTATPSVTSITISNAPSAGTDGTNKTYVDTAISAVNPATSVYAATTADIPGVYNNAAGGIGATFLTTATGTFTLDGTTPPLLSRILFKNQSVGPNTAAYNGVYTLTTNGTGITGSLFTRALDYDQPSDINSTGVIAVVNGTVNQLTGWLLTTTVTTVGTDAITYTIYNNAPIVVTQYDVLVGGASNAISSVGPGSAGQVLQSGGNAANPAYSTATYPSTAGTSGNVLTSNGTNWSSTAPFILNKTVTLQNADIKALNTTAFTLLSAPSAGQIIWLISLVSKLNYGGNNAFSSSASILARYRDSTGPAIQTGSTVSNTLLTASANSYGTGASALYVNFTSLGTNIEQQPLVLFASSAITGNANNDNTLDINMSYIILTLT